MRKLVLTEKFYAVFNAATEKIKKGEIFQQQTIKRAKPQKEKQRRRT